MARNPGKQPLAVGTVAGGRTRAEAGGALLVASILLVGVNLRPAVAGLSPILADLRASLGASAAFVSLLTSIPVLCFGAFAPLAPPLRARLGEERAVAAGLAVLLGGLLLRAAWPRSWLLAGTLLAGGGIAIVNVLLPSLVKRRLPGRVGPTMSLYTMTLSLGAALAGGLTVPAYEAAGRSLRIALAVWALPVVAALVLWLPQLGVPADRPGPPEERAGRGGLVWRSGLAWQV